MRTDRPRVTDDDIPLLAAHEALQCGDQRPFARWLCSARTRLTNTASTIWARWKLGPASAAVLDDMVAAASYAIYRAVRGYRWLCGKCTKPHARYGRVRCWSAASLRELEVHTMAEHPPVTLALACEPVRVAPHVTISRRCWYLAGAAMQGWCHREAALEQRRVTGERVELVMERLTAPECDLDAALDARAHFDRLPLRRRALVTCLFQGMDAARSLRLCSLTTKEILHANSDF